jgi:hypothetical protein
MNFQLAPSGSTRCVFRQLLDFVFPRTLIARIEPLCLFVFLRSGLCYGLLSLGPLAGVALPFATVVVAASDHLLSDDEFMPMLGTRGRCAVSAVWALNSRNASETTGQH